METEQFDHKRVQAAVDIKLVLERVKSGPLEKDLRRLIDGMTADEFRTYTERIRRDS